MSWFSRVVLFVVITVVTIAVWGHGFYIGNKRVAEVVYWHGFEAGQADGMSTAAAAVESGGLFEVDPATGETREIKPPQLRFELRDGEGNVIHSKIATADPSPGVKVCSHCNDYLTPLLPPTDPDGTPRKQTRYCINEKCPAFEVRVGLTGEPVLPEVEVP